MGDEQINLLMDGFPTKTSFKLTSNYEYYSDVIFGDGDISIAFINDEVNDRDVRIDYIEIDGVRRQAENMQYNTGAWANNYCGGGSYTEWLHCNGVIGFGNISDNFKFAKSISSNVNESNTSSVINIYPNPSTGNLSIELAGSDLNASITIFDLAGKVIYTRDSINEKLTQITNLESGMYIVNIISNDSNYNKKIVVK